MEGPTELEELSAGLEEEQPAIATTAERTTTARQARSHDLPKKRPLPITTPFERRPRRRF